MTILEFSDHRAKFVSPRKVAEYEQKLTATYLDEGRALADLAHPIIEPFRICEPDLEQHLKGAFLRWQMQQIKDLHRDDPLPHAVGLALAVTVKAFTDRLIELDWGIPPHGGEAA